MSTSGQDLAIEVTYPFRADGTKCPKFKPRQEVFKAKGKDAFKHAFTVIAQVGPFIWLWFDGSFDCTLEDNFVAKAEDYTDRDPRTNPSPMPKRCPVCRTKAKISGEGLFFVGCGRRGEDCLQYAVTGETVDEAIGLWNAVDFLKRPQRSRGDCEQCPFCLKGNINVKEMNGGTFMMGCECGAEGIERSTREEVTAIIDRLTSKRFRKKPHQRKAR